MINESICEKCCNNIYDLKKYNSFKLNISGCYSSKKEKITIKDCLKYQSEEPQKSVLLFCDNCQRKKKILPLFKNI